MTDEEYMEQLNRAAKISDEMLLQAGIYRQLGFKELAKWLKANAEKARIWQPER